MNVSAEVLQKVNMYRQGKTYLDTEAAKKVQGANNPYKKPLTSSPFELNPLSQNLHLCGSARSKTET